MRGYFITLEGSEKSGKSTHAKLLIRYLAQRGYDCLFIREPGSTRISEKIRRVLLDTRNKDISRRAEVLLYMAARAQLIEDIIEPALKENKIIVCDRFLDSTIVYQGYGLGIDISSIKDMGMFATKGIKPDLTLLIDLGSRKSLFRENHKKDRIELRPDVFHKRVWDGYLALAKKEPKRIKIIRLEDSIAATQEKIRKAVEKCLLKI